MKQYNVLKDIVLKRHEDQSLDLSSQPIDDLDTACLIHIEENDIKHALDLGGGAGKHSIRMAQAGARVTLIDRQDPSHNIQTVEESGICGKGQINLVQTEFTDINFDVIGTYDLVYSQRALNYLPYKDFMSLTEKLIDGLPPLGHFYLSVSGFDNEFGKTLDKRNMPLPERYGLPNEDMQKKHKIYTPTLIFKQEEIEDIIKDFGMEILSSSVSTFGNVKIIAVKI